MPTNIYFSCLPQAGSEWRSNHSGINPESKLPAIGNNIKPDYSKVTPALTSNLNHPDKSGITSFPQNLLRAQEQERQSLANELHDNLGQSLIMIKNQVLKMKNNLPEKTETLAQLNTLADMVTDSLQKIRNISYELRPYELNLLGLRQALLGLVQEIANHVPWQIKFDVPQLNSFFPKEREIYVYRIIQECLALIQKQADVSWVRLLAYPRQTAIIWELQVSGPATFFAFLADNFLKNYALLRLQEQLKMVEGTITFTASAPRTTIMQINVPLSSAYTNHEKA